MTNVVPLKVYRVIKVNGVERLACKVGKKWVYDATCNSINEMLDNKLVNVDVVSGWIASH
ncbi:MAG: hypothetical protein ACRBB6_04240 [Neptuniibacter sp.]